MGSIHTLQKLKITLNVPGILKSASSENVSHLSLFSFTVIWSLHNSELSKFEFCAVWKKKSILSFSMPGALGRVYALSCRPIIFYFPIKLMEYLKFGGLRKMQYFALPFYLQSKVKKKDSQFLKLLEQMQTGVYLFSRNVFEKHLNRSVCCELKLLPSGATLASSIKTSICTQTSALFASDSIRSCGWFE